MKVLASLLLVLFLAQFGNAGEEQHEFPLTWFISYTGQQFTIDADIDVIRRTYGVDIATATRIAESWSYQSGQLRLRIALQRIRANDPLKFDTEFTIYGLTLH